MAEKTRPTGQSVTDFLTAVPAERRRADAWTVLDLMSRVTGLEPAMWGPSIVGFGAHHYRYASGREGDMPAAGFSPRKAALTIYLMDGVEAHADLLARLGPHRVGVGCLYLSRLDAVDQDVLEQIVGRSFAALTRSPATDHPGGSSRREA